MQNELHERLEYLVNYSSQLIFVSSDSIAQQQKTLEAFVFQQHDDTEIAYFTAEENMDKSDYRRLLCRQLLGQTVGSYVRPLNELLAPLNNHEGPILVAITQAQNMPDAMLQELWDLVLQSRFAGNKQHLNVLLFADTQWSENAKAWLPTKNTDTPLLISSQSVVAQPEGSELDKMIAERRLAFKAHLDKRSAPLPVIKSPNLLTSKRFFVAMLIIFSATFVGLVGWQYSDDISGLFNPIEESPTLVFAQPPTQVGSAYSELTQSVGVPEDNSGTEILTSTEEIIPSVEEEQSATSETALASSWQDAIDSLNDTQQLTAIDSEIADINAEVSDSNAAEEMEPPIEASTVVETSNPPAQTPKFFQQWLTPTDYVIQLVGMKDSSAVTTFVESNRLSNVTHVYVTQRYGGDWFVVVFHQTYPSLVEARSAIALLPDYPNRSDAFIKQGNQILSEIAVQR